MAQMPQEKKHSGDRTEVAVLEEQEESKQSMPADSPSLEIFKPRQHKVLSKENELVLPNLQ